MKIYTRQGDSGETGLRFGDRVPKSALRVEAYGAVDEANAVIGFALAMLHGRGVERRGAQGSGARAEARLREMLLRVQRELFDLGAELSTPEARQAAEPRAVSDAFVELMEREIDELENELSPLRQFILPGGGPASAALHVARTVVRRAERRVVALAATETVAPELLRYLNRLSDFLFVAARTAAAAEGVPETKVEWER